MYNHKQQTRIIPPGMPCRTYEGCDVLLRIKYVLRYLPWCDAMSRRYGCHTNHTPKKTKMLKNPVFFLNQRNQAVAIICGTRDRCEVMLRCYCLDVRVCLFGKRLSHKSNKKKKVVANIFLRPLAGSAGGDFRLQIAGHCAWSEKAEVSLTLLFNTWK